VLELCFILDVKVYHKILVLIPVSNAEASFLRTFSSFNNVDACL